MLKNLLIYRLIILNVVGFVFLSWAYVQGWVTEHIREDITYLSLLIFILFLYNLILLAIRSVKISRLLNSMKRKENVVVISEKFRAKMGMVFEFPSLLTNLGFLGTLIGFGIAMKGLGSVDLGSADSSAIVGSMMPGINVSIFTATVGTFFGLWSELNKIIINGAMECMISDSERQ